VGFGSDRVVDQRDNAIAVEGVFHWMFSSALRGIPQQNSGARLM
jgi:hypothetical protein